MTRGSRAGIRSGIRWICKAKARAARGVPHHCERRESFLREAWPPISR
ncbi:hypothetical protein Y600_6028 [Burkholderia pseudomallei MSHR3709]|nr:hypothetical protein Y600_6028 [Burkholderia pseudomallei MSHR3709]